MAGLKQRLAASAAAFLIGSTAAAPPAKAVEKGSPEDVRNAVANLVDLSWPAKELPVYLGNPVPAKGRTDLNTCLYESAVLANGATIANGLLYAVAYEKYGVREFSGVRQQIAASPGLEGALRTLSSGDAQKAVQERLVKFAEGDNGCAQIVADAFKGIQERIDPRTSQPSYVHSDPAMDPKVAAIFTKMAQTNLASANLMATTAEALKSYANHGKTLPTDFCINVVASQINSAALTANQQGNPAVVRGAATHLNQQAIRACGFEGGDQNKLLQGFMKPNGPGF